MKTPKRLQLVPFIRGLGGRGGEAAVGAAWGETKQANRGERGGVGGELLPAPAAGAG